MKVLLLKDVYKLGRAGDIKRVADGYGRNYLIPQGLAVLATQGALKQVESIRGAAEVARTQANQELSGVADKLSALVLTFPAKAGDTGKLYGSITPNMIADAIKEKVGVEVTRRQLDIEPIRVLGEHKAIIRLTMDLTPEVTVIVHREGEVVDLAVVDEVVEEVVEVEATETADEAEDLVVAEDIVANPEA